MIQSSNLVNNPGLAGPSFVGLSHVLINYEVGLSSKRTWFSIVGDGDTLIDCCHIRPHPIWYPRKTVVFLLHMGSKNIVVSPLTRLGFAYLCFYVLQTMGVCIYIYIHVCLTDILTSYIYIYTYTTYTYLHTVYNSMYIYIYIYIYMLVPYDLLLRHDLLVYVLHIVHYTSKSYTFLHIYIYIHFYIFIYIYRFIDSLIDWLIDWLVDAYILYTICLYRYIWICVCIIHIIYVYYVYIYIIIMDLLQDDYGFYGSGWKFGIPKSIGSSLSLDGHISTSIFSG